MDTSSPCSHGPSGSEEAATTLSGWTLISSRVEDAQRQKAPNEVALFSELARHRGRVVTHRQFLANVWGEAHLTDVEHLRVIMRGLRGKPTRPAPRC